MYVTLVSLFTSLLILVHYENSIANHFSQCKLKVRHSYS